MKKDDKMVIIILAICVIYMAFITFLARSLYNIHSSPSKYEKINGYEEYRKSEWYWPTHKPYGKNDPPDNCFIPSVGISFILLSVWFCFSSILCVMIIAQIGGSVHPFINSSWWGIYFILLEIYAGILSNYISMYSRRPPAICYNLHVVFPKDRRSKALQEITKIVLIATIIMFPVRIIMLSNFGYITDEHLVYYPPFSSNCQEFSFCKSQFQYYYDNNQSQQRTILYNDDGQTFDVVSDYILFNGELYDITDYIFENTA